VLAVWGVRAVLKPGATLMTAEKRRQMNSQRQVIAVLSLRPRSGLLISSTRRVSSPHLLPGVAVGQTVQAAARDAR